MTLAFFKFGLPVLLGYTLFVGISGNWNPFAKPAHRQEKSAWLLGLWVGFSIAIVLALALYKAYGMPTDAISSLLVPSLALITLLVAPAVIVFTFFRRRRISKSIINSPDALDYDLSDVTQQQVPATNTTPVRQPVDDTSETKVPEKISMQEPEPVATKEPIPETPSEPRSKRAQERTVNRKNEKRRQSSSAEVRKSTADIRKRLVSERALRKKTENHLRITRKALSVLEAETRHFSIDKADGIIALEEQLAKSIQVATTAESDALRERVRRIEVEQNLTELKQKMVKAKQEIRRGAAARARALSTANKSIAFARQCVQIRTRLETNLEEAQTTIDKRQKSINSLLRALEKQKRKTQQEVSSMAKQLVLHEKQLKARRSLEQVARSVENKLTSRLVKKVAKAKPLISGMDQGESG